MEELDRIYIPHLQTHLRAGLAVLFTGAGFSASAFARDGRPIPLANELKQILWTICFPGDEFDATSSLQDLYQTALSQHRNALSMELERALSVDPDRLPGWYEKYFAMPWLRSYTLNVDDLERAAAKRFPLPRSISVISAAAARSAAKSDPGSLEVVHLNGTLEDIPDGVTFASDQYAERLARPDPWYLDLVGDLATRCFVIVGTQLDEPPLWQHVVMRRFRGGRGTRELRQRSYLVTPKLDPARRARLVEYNLAWIPMSAQEFAESVLPRLSAAGEQGHAALRARVPALGTHPVQLSEVQDLAAKPGRRTELLLGEEPDWLDVQSGRAIERACDLLAWDSVQRAIAEAHSAFILISGTAGSGKSASLRRVALKLVGEGHRVAWVDSETDISPAAIRLAMNAEGAPSILAIDDADIYGAQISTMVRDLCSGPTKRLVVAAMRSGRIDRAIRPAILDPIAPIEIAMPPLADDDIDALLELLERENRLGVLRAKDQYARRRAFRDQAGRQLLVAMLQATSDRRFEEKAIEEYDELDDDKRKIYASVCVASSFRISLSRDEVVVACGGDPNVTMNSLDQLVQRHLVREVTRSGDVRSRHRLLADVLVNELQVRGELGDVLIGLTTVAAAKVRPVLPRSGKPWRLLRQLINHDFLTRTIGVDRSRELYGAVEALLSWDSHFWLQRGSLEVEARNLGLARNFLGQARSIAPGDPFVETEWAYLLYREAIDAPGSPGAHKLAKDAHDALLDLIRSRGSVDNYPYHVLGSQGLSWARRGLPSASDRQRFLRALLADLRQGCSLHPRNSELRQLTADVEREYLLTSV